MSEAPVEDVVAISQRALAKCSLLKQEVHVLQEDTGDLRDRVDQLEVDPDE